MAYNSVKEKKIAFLIVVIVCLHCWLLQSSSLVVVGCHCLSSLYIAVNVCCRYCSLPLSFFVSNLIVALFIVFFDVIVYRHRCLSLLLVFVVVVDCRPLSLFLVVVHCC